MDSSDKENRSDEEFESPEEEEVDPRIQGELEKLNQSTDDINRCETELEDARQKFRSVLVEATLKLDELVKKIGKAVEESKPYWEARRVARQVRPRKSKQEPNIIFLKPTSPTQHLFLVGTPPFCLRCVFFYPSLETLVLSACYLL
ncbi:SH3 domain-binding protein 5-like [Megalobrama amblycephala]|uniref:SH3 domain-binding protein 5-like n=1 Tax=Megalobrama amblycephala TaxID=75352 RepID=UPI002013EE63|nr:SH3 domain-binding protein 5-like [Megalobrama amblycephala]